MLIITTIPLPRYRTWFLQQDETPSYRRYADNLRLIGMDHTRLTYLYQSRDMRLTDVHGENEFTKLLVG